MTQAAVFKQKETKCKYFKNVLNPAPECSKYPVNDNYPAWEERGVFKKNFQKPTIVCIYYSCTFYVGVSLYANQLQP